MTHMIPHCSMFHVCCSYSALNSMSAVTIAVGGRWREIEDENSDLRSKLAASEALVSMQRSELEDAFEKLRCTASDMDILQRENASKTEEVNALKNSLRASTAEIEEMTASAEVSASMIRDMNSEQDASSENIESLRLQLEERLHELGQFKSQLASKEQALQFESTLKQKAEAKTSAVPCRALHFGIQIRQTREPRAVVDARQGAIVEPAGSLSWFGK